MSDELARKLDGMEVEGLRIECESSCLDVFREPSMPGDCPAITIRPDSFVAFCREVVRRVGPSAGRRKYQAEQQGTLGPLLACPFCEHDSIVEVDAPYLSYVQCGKCGARTGNYNSVAEASYAWQQRSNNCIRDIRDEKGGGG